MRQVAAARELKDAAERQAADAASRITARESSLDTISSAIAEARAELDARNRYAILYRLHDAKKPETRARRLEQFVQMLREGKKLHQ